MATAIARDPAVSTIDIANTEAPDLFFAELCRALIHALQQHTSPRAVVTRLNFSQTRIASDGITQLARLIAMPQCRIQTLLLEHTTRPPSYQARKALIDALQRNQSLTEFRFQFPTERENKLKLLYMGNRQRGGAKTTATTTTTTTTTSNSNVGYGHDAFQLKDDVSATSVFSAAAAHSLTHTAVPTAAHVGARLAAASKSRIALQQQQRSNVQNVTAFVPRGGLAVPPVSSSPFVTRALAAAPQQQQQRRKRIRQLEQQEQQQQWQQQKQRQQQHYHHRDFATPTIGGDRGYGFAQGTGRASRHHDVPSARPANYNVAAGIGHSGFRMHTSNSYSKRVPVSEQIEGLPKTRSRFAPATRARQRMPPPPSPLREEDQAAQQRPPDIERMSPPPRRQHWRRGQNGAHPTAAIKDGRSIVMDDEDDDDNNEGSAAYDDSATYGSNLVARAVPAANGAHRSNGRAASAAAAARTGALSSDAVGALAARNRAMAARNQKAPRVPTNLELYWFGQKVPFLKLLLPGNVNLHRLHKFLLRVSSIAPSQVRIPVGIEFECEGLPLKPIFWHAYTVADVAPDLIVKLPPGVVMPPTFLPALGNDQSNNGGAVSFSLDGGDVCVLRQPQATPQRRAEAVEEAWSDSQQGSDTSPTRPAVSQEKLARMERMKREHEVEMLALKLKAAAAVASLESDMDIGGELFPIVDGVDDVEANNHSSPGAMGQASGSPHSSDGVEGFAKQISPVSPSSNLEQAFDADATILQSRRKRKLGALQQGKEEGQEMDQHHRVSASLAAGAVAAAADGVLEGNYGSGQGMFELPLLRPSSDHQERLLQRFRNHRQKVSPSK